MVEQTATTYLRGTVERFDDNSGFGAIRPDPDQTVQALFLFHRKSLRFSVASIGVGDRVIFAVERADRGPLAGDVQHEFVADTSRQIEEGATGTIRSYFPDRGYGFIALKAGEDAFFHISFF